jgi:hypothetical protein
MPFHECLCNRLQACFLLLRQRLCCVGDRIEEKERRKALRLSHLGLRTSLAA